MKFKNNGEEEKVRFPEEGGFRWKTVHCGDIVDLPKKVGHNYGFEEVKVEQNVKAPKEEKKEEKKKSKKK